MQQCKEAFTPCCSKCYKELVDKPCDTDHYCLYSDPVAYKEVETGGVICAAIGCGIMIVVVLFRDILKVWSCGGITTDAWNQPTKPDRQLTTMSAAYAAETMPHTMQEPAKQQPQQPMMQQPMMPMVNQPFYTTSTAGFGQQPQGFASDFSGFNQMPQGGMPMMMR